MIKNYYGGFALDGGEALVCKEGVIVVGQYDGLSSLVSLYTWEGKHLGYDANPRKSSGWLNESNTMLQFDWMAYGAEYVACSVNWTPGWPDEMPDGEQWSELSDQEREDFIRAFVN